MSSSPSAPSRSACPFVHLSADPGTEAAIAAAVVVATATIRVIVGLHIGGEHPVTLAEEIAVLDNLSNGRIGVIAELGQLDEDDATEDVSLLRASWSGRAITHRGMRWQVPAGLPGHVAPTAVMVTPPPVQLEMPLWVAGENAPGVGRSLGLPVVASALADIDPTHPVAPGRVELSGDLDADRQLVIEWSSAGATHLLCTLHGAATVERSRPLAGPRGRHGRVSPHRHRNAASGPLAAAAQRRRWASGLVVGVGELAGCVGTEQVASRHDANETPLVLDEDVADVALHHLLGDVGDVGMDIAPHQLAMSDVARRGLARATMGGQRPHDVALGHHALDVVAVTDDENADVGGSQRRGD